MSYFGARPPGQVLPFPPIRNSSRIAAWRCQGRLPLRRREALTAGRDAGQSRWREWQPLQACEAQTAPGSKIGHFYFAATRGGWHGRFQWGGKRRSKWQRPARMPSISQRIRRHIRDGVYAALLRKPLSSGCMARRLTKREARCMAALRKTHGAGTGRPPKPAPCRKCGTPCLSMRAARAHCVGRPRWDLPYGQRQTPWH